MEIWDAYDKDLNKIDGVSLIRGEEHLQAVLHLKEKARYKALFAN